MSLSAANFNLYLDYQFLDARSCSEILAELANVPNNPAAVYGSQAGGSVEEAVRKTIRLVPSSQTVERVTAKLIEAREPISSHFKIPLANHEEPQFLRYGVGDFFVAHQDGNTGMMLSEREQFRKISVVIFLNRQSKIPEPGCYSGGSLVFSEWRPGRSAGQYPFVAERGTLVAFPAETTHEVAPVTQGQRYSIVSWYG
jgi:SM-20-related protein